MEVSDPFWPWDSVSPIPTQWSLRWGYRGASSRRRPGPDSQGIVLWELCGTHYGASRGSAGMGVGGVAGETYRDPECGGPAIIQHGAVVGVLQGILH